VPDLRIQLHEVLFLREHFSSRNPDSSLSNIPALHTTLPCRAIAGEIGSKLRILCLPAGCIHDISADEILARSPEVDVLKVGNSDAGHLAVIQPARSTLEYRQHTTNAACRHLVHHVMTERAARICQTPPR